MLSLVVAEGFDGEAIMDGPRKMRMEGGDAKRREEREEEKKRREKKSGDSFLPKRESNNIALASSKRTAETLQGVNSLYSIPAGLKYNATS